MLKKIRTKKILKRQSFPPKVSDLQNLPAGYRTPATSNAGSSEEIIFELDFCNLNRVQEDGRYVTSIHRSQSEDLCLHDSEDLLNHTTGDCIKIFGHEILQNCKAFPMDSFRKIWIFKRSDTPFTLASTKRPGVWRNHRKRYWASCCPAFKSSPVCLLKDKKISVGLALRASHPTKRVLRKDMRLSTRSKTGLAATGLSHSQLD